MKTKFFVLVALFLSFCGYAYCQCPNGNCATGGGYYYPQFFNPFGWTYWNYGYTNTAKTNKNADCTACQKCGTCKNGTCDNDTCEDCSCEKCECENCPCKGTCEKCPKKDETADENVVPIPAEIPQETPKEETVPTEDGNPSLDNSPLEETPMEEEELTVPIPVQPLENSGETQEKTDTQDEMIVSVDSGEFPPFVVDCVQMINGYRVRMGLRPLELDKQLVTGCQYHSRYMASYGFQHAYNGGMECIAMGVSTPESLVNMWLNSSGHRAIIMSNAFKIGVGSYGTYHTLRVR